MNTPTNIGAPKTMPQRLWAEVKRDKFLLLMLLLPVAYYVIFCYWPMYGVVIAFKDFNVRKGILGSDWVGLKYISKFVNDRYFGDILRNTVVLSVYELLWSFPAPIIFALLLNELRGNRFKRLVQSICYIPHFISTVVICSLVVNFLSSTGFLNHILSAFLGDGILFMREPKYWRTIYIASGIWQGVGWGSIIYLAALTGIDVELYEAATVDGARRWGKMRYITLPGIMPTISIMFILAVGRIMSLNTEKALLLSSGPTLSVSNIIQTYVYTRGIQNADFSYATAVSLFQSVINLGMLLAANTLSKKAGGDGLF